MTFEDDVRPLLKARCFHCHGEEQELAGGLDLRLRRLILKGGDSGAAIVPENAAKSYLVERLKNREMPPEDSGEPLTADQINVIVRWVNQGAQTAGPEPESVGKGLLITAEDRNFWAFRPVQRPSVPAVKDASHVRNAIDAFLLRKLEARELSFSPAADRRTLIRRLTLDLHGIPPAPDDVAAFTADLRPNAYERLVDRLLASPRYGERWGRHWLDVAGYADSEGVTNADAVRKWAWKYRDYVIRAFNADKPFDEFVKEQLAGDELIGRPLKDLTADETDMLIATGFLRMAPDGTADRSLDAGVARNQVVADTVEIVTSSLLAMTVRCAQCHEHRYDPIPHADYYRLRAVFEPAMNPKAWKSPPVRLISLYTDEDRKRAAEIDIEAKKIDAEYKNKQKEFIEAVFQKELAKLPEQIRETVSLARNTPAKKRTPAQKTLLQKHPSVNVTPGSLYLYDKKASDELKKIVDAATAVRANKPTEEFVRAAARTPGPIPDTFVFHRGDHEQPKEKVEPAGLTILAGDSAANQIPSNDPDRPTTGRRLAYAEYLTSGRHPLTARVFVNRVWKHHFGRGIVDTPGDFGRLGERPTHPELLDWLASEFVQSGWSVKRLHRLILTSAAYRQALRTDPKYAELDPDNLLYGGARLMRLDAEAVRDSVLAVSGRLNSKPFGPAVPVMADRVGQWVIGKENLNAGRPGKVIPMHGEEYRRSVYVQVRRSRPLSMLDAFDAPRMEPNCDARSVSTVAPQSLMLMNGAFALSQAEHFASRLMKEAPDDPKERIRRAWQLACSRAPDESELAAATQFLEVQTADLKQRAETSKQKDAAPEKTALASLCQVLFGSNEFLYVD